MVLFRPSISRMLVKNVLTLANCSPGKIIAKLLRKAEPLIAYPPPSCSQESDDSIKVA